MIIKLGLRIMLLESIINIKIFITIYANIMNKILL